MKLKKVFTIVLSTIMGMALLAGCSAKKEAAKSSSETEPTAAVKVADQTKLQEIKDKGVIVIGTEGTYAPYTYHDQKTDELTGYDVEIAKKIGEILGVKVEFAETAWDSLIGGLDSDKYDMVMNEITITDERSQKYDFSTPYVYSYPVLVVEESNDDIKSFDDIKGKKVSCSVSTNFGTIADNAGAEIVNSEGNFSKSVEMISNGRVDAALNDQIAFGDFMKQQSNAKIKVAVKYDEPMENAVLMNKGEDDLAQAINDALKQLSDDGTLSELSEKFLGTDISQQ